jgi:hypothetical protein
VKKLLDQTMKKFLHIIIFVSVVLVLYLLFDYYKWPGHTAIPFLIAIIYALIHLVKSMFLFFKKRRIHAAIFLINFLLFLLVAAKLLYYYYNIFLAICLLAISTFIYFKFYKKATNDILLLKGFATLIGLVCINIILTIIPEKTIWQFYLKDTCITYRKLTWDDFQGKMPDDETDSEKAAATSSSFDYRINKAYDYPPAIIVSFFDKKWSWKRNPDEDHSLLLIHEQGHFAISEIYTRKAQDTILKCWGKSPHYIEDIIKKYKNRRDQEQIFYDSITDHGRDSIEQKRWTAKLSKELKE